MGHSYYRRPPAGASLGSARLLIGLGIFGLILLAGIVIYQLTKDTGPKQTVADTDTKQKEKEKERDKDKGRPGAWDETAPGGARHQFKETARTAQYVDLELVQGNTRVRLYDDRCDVSFRPFTETRTFYRGKWEK